MENVTIKHIVENINALTQLPTASEDGSHIDADDVIALIYNEVEQLAELVGIELEG